MKALVAGDTGIIGRHLVQHLINESDADVVGVSRGVDSRDGRFTHVQADLLAPDALTDALRAHTDISHVFYAARSPQSDQAIESDINAQMLANVVTAANEVSTRLAHVHLMEGMKWYGSHLGAWKTPARENDARHVPPNMYYAQQDWLEAAADARKWSWSALRPHQVCGFSDVYPHNAMGVIAVYGAVSAELALPLYFPGTPACFDSVSMVTDASLLARAMHWCVETPAAANRALNISNGDYFRWSNLWPELATFFGIEAGPVRTFSLTDFMADKQPLWDAMVSKHGLREASMEKLVNWTYGDFTFRAGWDDMASTTALRHAGFLEHIDSHDMFLELLRRYRTERIIP